MLQQWLNYRPRKWFEFEILTTQQIWTTQRSKVQLRINPFASNLLIGSVGQKNRKIGPRCASQLDGFDDHPFHS